MIKPLWAQDDSCRVCGATMNPLCASGEQVILALNLIGKEFGKAKAAQAMRDVATGAAAANKDVRAISGYGASQAYGAASPWATPGNAFAAAQPF